jgi:hypothetical protein
VEVLLYPLVFGVAWLVVDRRSLLVLSAPALSEPQSKEPRPSAATMRRAYGAAGRPRAASRAPQPTRQGAQAASSQLC